MPGSASRVCSSASCRSLILNTVNTFRHAFSLGASRTSNALGVISSGSIENSAPNCSFSSCASSKNLRASQAGIVLGSQIISPLRIYSKLDLDVGSVGFSWPFSSPCSGTRGFRSSNLAFLPYPAKKRSGSERGEKPLSQLKSRKDFTARKTAKSFSGALSSIKNLTSENARGKSRPNSATWGDSRKPKLSSRGRSVGKPARVGDYSSVSTEVKFKKRANTEGVKLKARRKRMKPRTKDITYKRRLDSGVVDDSEQQPTQEGGLSLNAQFRQIQPSRELLAHIEENFLGRRRLAEWRRGGYDPKRTAPLDDLPQGKDKRSSIKETVFKKKLTFIAAAKQRPSLPLLQYPEIAFAGRSNVGKSSLVNALTRQWGIARTSPKPGLTQSINFFTLGSQLCLVDLPGYGFAYAKEEKKEDWEELVKYFVQTRPNLKRVCLLVDSKWGLKPRDEELLNLMESAGTRYQIVLTKTDVLSPVDLARRATQILQVLENKKHLIRPLMMVSSKTGAGIESLRASLAGVASESRVLEAVSRV